ncbi:DUF333 domain-containing protein, partial [Erwinia amylovora]
MKAATSLLLATCLLLSACSSHRANEPPQQATAAHVSARVALSYLAV